MDNAQMILRSVLRRWYVVLLCALMGAGGLYVEKSDVAPSVAVQGDVLISRIVKVDPVPYAEFGNTAEEIDLTEGFETWRTAYTLMEVWENDLEMEKVCAGWYRLGVMDRVKWFSRHLKFIKLGPGIYEFDMNLAETDAKDTAYVQEHKEQMLDGLAKVISEVSAPYIGEAHWTKVEDFDMVNLREKATQGGLQKKYAVVGFVLGALAGIAILSVLALRKEKQA